jgi:hypothetical protein
VAEAGAAAAETEAEVEAGPEELIMRVTAMAAAVTVLAMGATAGSS